MKTPFFATSHQLLLTTSPQQKCEGVSSLYQAWLLGEVFFDEDFPVSEEIVGALPDNLSLVDPKHLKRRRLSSDEGKAALIHAIAHIEYNAINIALDACYRFRKMPIRYYYDWLKIAHEEAYHYTLLAKHLQNYGYGYGDFPAHLGLWEMVQKTGHDVLIRMALVPRLLEARGLDVTPEIAKRLSAANDEVGAQILMIIFHDEISHVRTGNHWYYQLCKERGLDPRDTFVDLLKRYAPNHLRGPIAIEHRLKAGFEACELDALVKMIQLS
ncbi:MAG: ferritin-like domain-containing protein [Candidatus Berkiella sp.]